MKSYVRSCDACQCNKVVRHAPFGLLSPFLILGRPWSTCGLCVEAHVGGIEMTDLTIVPVVDLTADVEALTMVD